MAGVKLHLLVSGKDARLSFEEICKSVPEWNSPSIWFCGPSAFVQALRKDFTANGLYAKHFHQELFQMR